MTGSSLPAVSVVVPTRDRPQLVHEAVLSILAGDVLPDEIVVIDQGTSAAAEVGDLGGGACEVRHQRERGRGLSRARNAGIAAARNEVIVFVDDDLLVDNAWLGVLVTALVHGGPRLVVTGRVLETAPEQQGSFAPSSVTSTESKEFQGRLGDDVIAGGNLAVHRSAFEEVGLFDVRLGAGSRFPGAEDNDFGYRVLEAGYRIRYEPAALVHHRAWRPHADFARIRWGYGLGQGGFYAKHLRLRDLHMLGRFVRHAGQRIILLPVRTFYDRRRFTGDLAFLAGLVVGFFRWLATERGTSST